MNFRRRVFFLLLVTASCTPAAAAEPSAQPIDLLTEPFASGQNSFWQTFSEGPDAAAKDTWTLSDGVLVCRGEPKGYLYSTRDFTNFVLKLQWRWPADKKSGRGGVLVRTTGPNKIWPRSLEAQINSGDAGDFWGLNGYRLEGPAERTKALEHPQFGKLINVKKTASVEKPAGQWNDYEITVRGDTVTLVVNGKEVNKATGCDIAAGKICLTAEGDEIHFRKVQLIPLD